MMLFNETFRAYVQIFVAGLFINHLWSAKIPNAYSGGTAPKVIEVLADKTMKAQKETSLQCKISGGEPQASIHWYKDAKELYDGKRYHLSYAKDVATLSFTDTGVNDSGTYRCEAVNKLGRVNTECKLTVECMSARYLLINK